MTTEKTCAVEDCGKPTKSKGWCGMHRERARRHGDLNASIIVDDDIRRFWAKVDRRGDHECWPWKGTVLRDGYGQFFIGGERRAAHRYAYELLAAPIPEGLTIDHVRARGCHLRHCVNPAHLEPVTVRENTMRSSSESAKNARKTVCPSGHAYDVKTGSYRRCRTCFNEWQRRYRRAKKVGV